MKAQIIQFDWEKSTKNTERYVEVLPKDSANTLIIGTLYLKKEVAAIGDGKGHPAHLEVTVKQVR